MAVAEQMTVNVPHHGRPRAPRERPEWMEEPRPNEGALNADITDAQLEAIVATPGIHDCTPMAVIATSRGFLPAVGAAMCRAVSREASRTVARTSTQVTVGLRTAAVSVTRQRDVTSTQVVQVKPAECGPDGQGRGKSALENPEDQYK